MNNKQRLNGIQKFLENFRFEAKVPDFIGAWSSKNKMNSFNGIIYKSYLVGYVINEESSIVVDSLGVSTLDNPFTTEGIMVQEYDAEKAFEEVACELIRNYPDTFVKIGGFQKDFPISDWVGTSIVGQFQIAGDDFIGFFIIRGNDGSDKFLEEVNEIKKEIATTLGL